MSKWNKLESCEECKSYLENGGNEFLFRLASTKQCLVTESMKKENYELEKIIFKWHSRFLAKKLLINNNFKYIVKHLITGLFLSNCTNNNRFFFSYFRYLTFNLFFAYVFLLNSYKKH